MKRNDLIAFIVGVIAALCFVPGIFVGIGVGHSLSGRQSPAQIEAHTRQVTQEVRACSAAPIQDQGFCFRYETP